MSICLTKEELVELTGYQRPSCMIRKLREYRLRFFIAADGYPRVPRGALENQKVRPKATPNFDALKK